MGMNWATMGIWFFDQNANHMYTVKGMADEGVAPLTLDERKAMAKRVAAALNNEGKSVTNVRATIKRLSQQAQDVMAGGGTINEAIDYFEQVLLAEFIE